MSLQERFNDTQGRDDILETLAWSKDLRGNVAVRILSNKGVAHVTVDIHEFKAWLDQAYAEVFGQPKPEGVAHVLMAEDDGTGWNVAGPIAIYTDAREAIKARDEGDILRRWICTAPVNPSTSDRKDQA